MYNFFNLRYPLLSGVVRFPLWLYAQEGLQRSLQVVQRYYRMNPTAVESSHFLVRLLQSINVPQSHALDRYFENVDALALNLSMALKMTSAISKGQIFKGIFYGKGSSEILVAHNEDFDPVWTHRNWQSVQAVRVLRHPWSDLNLALPDGGHYSDEEGLAIIAINIPMLAIQYRAFRLNEMSQTLGGNNQRSLMQFVRMYVLPNMLPTQLDLALLNRVSRKIEGEPVGVNHFKHSFYLIDYSAKVDEVIDKIITSLSLINRDFSTILRTLPTVASADAIELLRLPDIAPTRQVVWALTMARLNALSLLFRLSKGGATLRNATEVNAIRRSAMLYKNESLMKSMLPFDIYLEVQAEIESIVQQSY